MTRESYFRPVHFYSTTSKTNEFVERLVQEGLPFVFKGGTYLVLLLGRLRRFSVDVDIVTAATPAKVAEVLEVLLNK